MGIDILGIDIMGVDILGIDILALPTNLHQSANCAHERGLCFSCDFNVYPQSMLF